MPRLRMIRPIGVTVRKNNRPIISGLIILCSNNPKRYHSLLGSASRRGMVRAAMAKNAATNSAHSRKDPGWSDRVSSGNRATMIKTTAKMSPKERSDPALTSSRAVELSCNVCFY